MSNEEDAPNPRPLSDEAIARAKRAFVQGNVGYGNPPEHSRFKKGQSGNPRGRPRGTPTDLTLAEQPMLEAVLRAGRKSVRMREGDRVTEVSTIEAIAQAVTVAALKGNARSQGLAIDLIRMAEQALARDIAHRNARWSDYKERTSLALAEAARANQPLPKVLPHPDDIEIDPFAGPRFHGSFDQIEEARMNDAIAFCDVLLLQDELDQRSSVRLDGTPLTEPGSALLLFAVLQRSVPERLRLSTTQIHMAQRRHGRCSRRKLMKGLRQTWRKVGKTVPRGYVMPNLSHTKRRVEFAVDLLTEFQAGNIDVDALARGEIDDDVIDLLGRDAGVDRRVVPGTVRSRARRPSDRGR